LLHPPLLSDTPQLSICTKCFESCQKTSYNGPLQFTIANGLYMEILLENFHYLTRTELAMTTLA
jgi:hypothetical protein